MFLKSAFIFARLLFTVLVIILYIHYFFPQSWGFYTIKSGIPLYNIYKIHNKIVDKIFFIKTNRSYGAGISKKGMRLYTELYYVRNKKLPWHVLIEDSLGQIAEEENYTVLSASSEYPNLKGNFLITKTERPSYADLKKSEQFQPQKQYVLVHIR